MIAPSHRRSANDDERSSILKFPTIYDPGNISNPPASSGGHARDPEEKLTLRKYYTQELLPTFSIELSPRSLKEDEGALRRWEELTDDPDIRDVTSETLQTFRDVLLPGRSPHTVNKIWREIKSIFACACDDGIIAAVPCVSRRMKSRLVHAPSKRQRETVTVAELERLWNSCHRATYPTEATLPGSLTTMRLWRVLLVMQWTYGQRTRDLTQLKWQDVRFSDRLIQFEALKTSKLQGLPMTTTVERHLRSIQSDDDMVFPGFRSPGCYLHQQKRWKRGYYATWRAEILPAANVVDLQIKHFRERVVTEYNAIEDKLGNWIAGHYVPGVSAQNYDLPTKRIREAVESAPVPECFLGLDPGDRQRTLF
ncbi:hypothetical protein KOR42_10770 [Thalassoglobus neptunius]|uniref:Phage integrase family protein n=1 Tax=Thalassoglobus neptunius TaxID=1938619 RepID=A0A5C5X632_9PLAN|nr:tyrosine-type recombinase/integrase [Thalassoglobus neptunius]TWT57713.1 hypothetical protein KOR42_10770 [Thalassoglobus neptunius]